MTYYDHATALALGLEPWGKPRTPRHLPPVLETAPLVRLTQLRVGAFLRFFPAH